MWLFHYCVVKEKVIKEKKTKRKRANVERRHGGKIERTVIYLGELQLSLIFASLFVLCVCLIVLMLYILYEA